MFDPNSRLFKVKPSDFAKADEVLLTVWVDPDEFRKGESVPKQFIYQKFEAPTPQEDRYKFEFEGNTSSVTIVFFAQLDNRVVYVIELERTHLIEWLHSVGRWR